MPVSRYFFKNLKYLVVLCVGGYLSYVICNNFFIGYGWLSAIVHACICGVLVSGCIYLSAVSSFEGKYIFALGMKVVGRIKKGKN